MRGTLDRPKSMTVASCWIRFYINSQPNDLKSKRAIVKHIKESVQKTFKVSVEIVGERDKWQIATLGIAIVTRNRDDAHRIIEKIVAFLERSRELSIIGYGTEVYA